MTRSILLVRHGEVETDVGFWLDHDEYVQFARSYGQTSLKGGSRPPPDLVALVREASLVVHSHLPRARESVGRMEIMGIATQERLGFEEVDIPLPPKLPGRLPMMAWSLARRILWQLNMGGGETWSAASRRAAAGAAHLAACAGEHQRVALVGHGLLNALISRALRQSGWKGQACRGWPYWGWEVLERDVEEHGAP